MGTAQLLTLMACLAGSPDATIAPEHPAFAARRQASAPASSGAEAQPGVSLGGAQRPSAVTLLGIGAGAAAVAAPASVALGVWVGTLSRSLVLAALPALGVVALLPPLAVTFAMFYAAERLQPGSGRISPGVFVAAGVQVALLVGAILLGAQAQDLGDAALFSLAQVVALPWAVYPFVSSTSSPVPPGEGPPVVGARGPVDDLARPRPVAVLSLPVASWRF